MSSLVPGYVGQVLFYVLQIWINEGSWKSLKYEIIMQAICYFLKKKIAEEF